ncbi:phage portal protein [Clostridium sp. B9]|uniref:phage portal protein n=1 Tax=Clostridium sp. B9 TaxID=3423224 RepID=UPI003D2EC538
MGIRSFFEKMFKKDMEGSSGAMSSDTEASIIYKEFAIQSCISIITNALVLAEFETYEEGKFVKKNNYYLFNIEPNKNQNATEFWMEVISKLIYKNECLIVQIEDELFVADTFYHTEYLYYEDTYKDLIIRGFPLNRTLKESDVIYLKLNNKNIKEVVDSLYKDYSSVLGVSISAVKKAFGEKGILKLDSMIPQQGPKKEAFENLMNKDFKNYFSKTNAVLPLQNGFDYIPGKKDGNIKNSRDVRANIDDVIDFVAAGFHVPAGVIKGNIAGVEGQTDNFLMFCINPISKLITTEFNRKIYGREEFKKRSYVKMNTQRIRDVNISDMSKAADLLFRIGVNSIDDNLEMLGKERLNEKWSERHYVTKNYQSVVDLEGGDKNGTKNS